ncbi:hypothetical protein [Pseudomonas fluorescens]|uniref:hypothetical protein n=1 Tax=Pseudomonas fluorescens TaxID=294 RepID=UPI0019128277|nr:hypothetical protein [Pseudomonas fluorescens]
MTPIRKQLLEQIVEPNAFDQPQAQVHELQVLAAQELFEIRIEQIPLLRHRAAEAGISRIDKLEQLVPLLFSHTVYKSYPQAFIDNNQWDRMLQWLQTLSVADVSNVDVTGVKDVDDWLERLYAAGHRPLATSGSSGKCSFLNHTAGDQEDKARHYKHATGWPFVRAEPNRALFWLGPINGYNSAIESAQIGRINWGRAGATYALTEVPLLISEVSRAAAMRKAIAEGTALPEEIQAFEAAARLKARQGVEDMRKLAETILDHRHEPIMISGLWAQHMMIIECARERGIGDGEFHPQTIVQAGGGIKGVALPADYQEQVARFYGDVIRPAAYGMTEIAQLMPRCDAGRYHRAPGLIWLITDEPGERLLTVADANADGLAEGRFAFLDLLYEGRWGGVITGDKVTVDFSDTCPCGRHGPTLLDNITRFSQIGQDDHIGCAGTLDAYIRGALAE